MRRFLKTASSLARPLLFLILRTKAWINVCVFLVFGKKLKGIFANNKEWLIENTFGYYLIWNRRWRREAIYNTTTTNHSFFFLLLWPDCLSAWALYNSILVWHIWEKKFYIYKCVPVKELALGTTIDCKWDWWAQVMNDGKWRWMMPKVS